MADGADKVLRRDYTEAELLRFPKADLVALVCQYRDEIDQYQQERQAMLFVIEHQLLELGRMGDDVEWANRELARLRADAEV